MFTINKEQNKYNFKSNIVNVMMVLFTVQYHFLDLSLSVLCRPLEL